MKKICLVCLLNLTVTVAANAQDYKKLKVGFGFVLADFIGKYENFTYPFVTLEPAYRVRDDLAIGLRIEATAGVGGTCACEMHGIGSYTVNGQYYLSAYKFRPFVGAGLGLYAGAETKFGFYPRAGFDLGHFSFSLDYNLLQANKIYNTSLNTNYLGFRIGFFVGGGRKSEKEKTQ
jgi:hypothetical protein